MSSPGKITSTIKGQYKRIVDRVRDDAILGDLNIPLPNINAKSVSSFIARQEKRANVRATVMPKVKPHRSVTSAVSMAPAACLPTSLEPPDRPQIQYHSQPHVAGKQHGEKRRLELDEPEAETSHTTKNSYFLKGISHVLDEAATVSSRPTSNEAVVAPTPCNCSFSSSPPLVLPAQPYKQLLCRLLALLCYLTHHQLLPTENICCQINLTRPVHAARCPSVLDCPNTTLNLSARTKEVIKRLSLCPTTRKSTTPGFDVVYEHSDHIKRAADEELETQQQ